MVKVGDKYILEVAEVTRGAESGCPKYRIKGFDNLFFDDKGISRLKKIEDKKPEDKFDIGDEVYIESKDKYGIVIKDEIVDLFGNKWYHLLFRDGDTETYCKDSLKKTGCFCNFRDLLKAIGRGY